MDRTVKELYTVAKQRNRETGEVQLRPDLNSFRLVYTWSKTDTVRRPKPLPQNLWREATPRMNSFSVMKSGSLGYPVGPFDVDAPTCSNIDLDPIQFTGEHMQNLDGRLRLKISQLKFSLGQDLYEWRQTTNLFLPLARDIIQTMRALRSFAGSNAWTLLVGARDYKAFRNLYKTGGSRLKTVADRWLSYQYGLKPLMEDIYGAAEVLAVRSSEDWTRTVKQNGFQGFSDLREVPIRDFGAGRAVPVFRTMKVYQRVGIQYRVVADPLVRDLAAFGISNPALTLWELCPWSFIVDQVIPIGKYLEASDAMFGLRDWCIHDGFKIHQTVQCDAGDVPSTYEAITTFRYPPRYSLDNLSIAYKAHRDVSSLVSVVNDLALLVQQRLK